MKRIFAAILIALVCLLPCSLSATGIDDPLEKLAKDLGGRVSVVGLKRLGVPEFTNASGNLGGNTGVAGKYFAERIEEYLINDSDGGFEVIERTRLNAVLREAKIQASGLTDEKTRQELIGKIKGLDSLVLGSVIRTGSKARIMCKVVKLWGASSVAAKSTELDLDADLLTLFGASAVIPAGKPTNNQQIVQQAQKPVSKINNPFSNSDFNLQVVVNGKSKPLYLKDGNVYISGKPSEEYILRITNNSKHRAAVALFIDGLNTIAQKRELASGATKWILDAGQTADIQGWQMTDKVARKFVFVGSEESVAAKQHYTDEMGIITAAFYPEKEEPPVSIEEVSKGLGTGEGDEVPSEVTRVEFKAVSTPSAILTLRYENANAIKAYTPLAN